MGAPTLRGLALCAGAGGLELGVHIAEPSYRTVCYVERARSAIDVLVARMRDGCLAPAPVWTDLATFDARPWRGVDLVSAGYPCQPFSISGLQRGFDDPRNLWPHVARIIREARPRRVFLENVTAHLGIGFPVVAGDLSSMGFRFAAGVHTALEVGGSHHRSRLFVLADADGQRGTWPDRPVAPEAWPGRARHRLGRQPVPSQGRGAALGDALFPPGPDAWEAWAAIVRDARASGDLARLPALPRMDDELAGWVDRQRLAGNGVVSLAAAFAYRSLSARLAAGDHDG